MAVRLGPESESAHLNRGHLRVDLGQCEAALADFDEAVRINPRRPRSYVARGDCRLKVGLYSGARQDFLKAAELYGEQNRPAEAEKARRRAFGA
jgi:Flp pilus assembly protein TadD